MGSGPKLVSFTFHDLVGDDPDESGFTGAGPARYKLGRARFDEHLDVLGGVIGASGPVLVSDAGKRPKEWLLTFDDGGTSALEIAHLLVERGWLGHFFVTAGRIGQRGFVDESAIRELAAMGHVVGSHSQSHPARMSACPQPELEGEWEQSVRVLSGILGTQCTTGSVPGGSYSERVAEAAGKAGIRMLFTSEPRVRPWHVGDCRLLGRFAVHDRTDPQHIAAIARGDVSARAREFVGWNARKAAKKVGGNAYLRARSVVLSRRR